MPRTGPTSLVATMPPMVASSNGALDRQPLPLPVQVRVQIARAARRPATVAVRSPWRCTSRRVQPRVLTAPDRSRRPAAPGQLGAAAANDGRAPAAPSRRRAPAPARRPCRARRPVAGITPSMASSARRPARSEARRTQSSEALGQAGLLDRVLRGTGPGTSPHRRGVGSTLPGLHRRCGSIASRTCCITSRSSSENIRGM